MTKKDAGARAARSALIGELLDELRKASFARCAFAVDRSNPQSKAFWEKNGFALTGEEFPERRFGVSADGTRCVKK